MYSCENDTNTKFVIKWEMKHQLNMLHYLQPTSKLENNSRHPRKHVGVPNPDESSTYGQLQRRTVNYNVYLCLHLEIQSCMGLVHTCTKYRYMQAQTKDMHEQDQLFPNNMIYGNSSLQTCKIQIRKVSRPAKFGLGKSVYLPNWIRKVMP